MGLMKSLLLEANKIPGVHYALTNDGIELPIVDVTHPAFALTVTDTEQRALVEKFLHEKGPFASLPMFLRNWLQRFFLRGSMLANGIRQAQGTFMTGMHTYLLKLGPTMLGSAYAKPIDRRIAASLPVFAVRLHLQDVAQLMAEALLPVLIKEPARPLQFLNIAGGPAIDSLNTLILLSKKQPGILAGRRSRSRYSIWTMPAQPLAPRLWHLSPGRGDHLAESGLPSDTSITTGPKQPI